MSESSTISFKRRGGMNLLDTAVDNKRKRNVKFDLDLITIDGKKVSAHRFVLAMFSKYMAKQLHDVPANGYTVLPLGFRFEIVEKMVRLLYAHEVTVPTNLKHGIMDALQTLKIVGIDMKNPNDELFKKPTDAVCYTGQPKQMPWLAQQQPNKLVQFENNVEENEQMGSYIPMKRQRAQSTYVESSSHEYGSFLGEKAPIVPGNQKTSFNILSTINLPRLNISKMSSTTGNICANTLNPSPTETQNAIQAQAKMNTMVIESQPRATVQQKPHSNAQDTSKGNSHDKKIGEANQNKQSSNAMTIDQLVQNDGNVVDQPKV